MRELTVTQMEKHEFKWLWHYLISQQEVAMKRYHWKHKIVHNQDEPVTRERAVSQKAYTGHQLHTWNLETKKIDNQ